MATDHTPQEWEEFCRFMEDGDGRECLPVWLTFKDGTFHLSHADGKAKALERFSLWLGRKRGLAQARFQPKLIVNNKPKAKPPKIDLTGLTLADLLKPQGTDKP